MTKTLTMEVQRKNAERQLFGARRALGHLVELYDSGQWKTLYREDTFAEAVRQARQAVDHWTNVMVKSEDAERVRRRLKKRYPPASALACRHRISRRNICRRR